MDENLGVRSGAKNVAASLELASELRVIVDLTVIGDDNLPVFVGERLRAAVDVDNAQSHVRESDALSSVKTIPVGPAMAYRSGHLAQRRQRHTRRIPTHDPRDTAHQGYPRAERRSTSSTSCGPRCRYLVVMRFWSMSA